MDEIINEEIEIVTNSLPIGTSNMAIPPISGNIILLLMLSGLVGFLLCAIGLYMINKKFKEKNAWVAFIPIVQIRSYFQASQKPFLQYFVYPFLAVIVGALLTPLTFGLTGLVADIYILVMWIKLINAISIRCGKGTGTTILLLFFPFIMLPYLGFSMKEK